MIIKDLLPLRTVEKEGFLSIMERLVGKLVVKKRGFFTAKLETEYSNAKTTLIMAFEDASFVSTTEDLWTHRRRSFMGMTVHWLRQDLIRRSVCLTVRRVFGSHTFDVIAKTIDDIHKEFGDATKVNCTITDSGSNFLKAFNVFGVQSSKNAEEDESEVFDLDEESASNLDGD